MLALMHEKSQAIFVTSSMHSKRWATKSRIQVLNVCAASGGLADADLPRIAWISSRHLFMVARIWPVLAGKVTELSRNGRRQVFYRKKRHKRRDSTAEPWAGKREARVPRA